MSGNWDAVKRGLQAEDISFLRQMALNAYGSGAEEGDQGGAGYIGILEGRVIKFNTHFVDRLVPEFLMSKASRSSSLGALAKLQTIVRKVQDQTGDQATKLACANILKNLEEKKDSSLLTRKIVASTLMELGGQSLWNEMKSGKDMTAYATTKLDTGFDYVKKDLTLHKKMIDDTIQTLDRQLGANLDKAALSPYEEGKLTYLRNELGLVKNGLQSLKADLDQVMKNPVLRERVKAIKDHLYAFFDSFARIQGKALNKNERESLERKIEKLRQGGTEFPKEIEQLRGFPEAFETAQAEYAALCNELSQAKVDLEFGSRIADELEIIRKFRNDIAAAYGISLARKKTPAPKTPNAGLKKILAKIDSFKSFSKMELAADPKEPRKRGDLLVDALRNIIDRKKSEKPNPEKPKEGDESGEIFRISDAPVNFSGDEDAVRRIRRDIVNGITRYKTNDAIIKSENSAGFDGKLASAAIPNEIADVFKDLYPDDAKMTVVEREVINEILKEYDTSI